MSFKSRRRIAVERATRQLPDKLRQRFKWYPKTLCQLQVYQGIAKLTGDTDKQQWTIAIENHAPGATAQLLAKLFAETPACLADEQLPFFTVTDYLQQHHPDTQFVFLQDDLYRRPHFQSHSIRMPIWIEVQIPLQTPKAVYDEKHSGFYDIKRRIRKNQLSYALAKASKEQLDVFYHQHFKPYMAERHGERAIIPGFDALYQEYQNDQLLTVYNAEQTAIAIAILRPEHDKQQVRLCRLGILQADDRYVRLGAIGALYYFTAEHYRSEGFELMNYGLTSSFVDDPITRFKIRLWGQLQPKRKGMHVLAIPLKRTAVSEQFLTQNALVYRNHEDVLTLLSWHKDKQESLTSKYPFFQLAPQEIRHISTEQDFLLS